MVYSARLFNEQTDPVTLQDDLLAWLRQAFPRVSEWRVTKDCYRRDLVGIQPTNMGRIIVTVYDDDYHYSWHDMKVADGEFRLTAQYNLHAPGWKIYLPHQCGEWDIAHNEDDEYYDMGGAEPVSTSRAIEQLASFVSEAQELLEGVRQAQEDQEQNPGIFETRQYIGRF